MFLPLFVFNVLAAVMSDFGTNDFGRHLYNEQFADDLQRCQRSTFVSDVGSLFASIAAFTSTDALLIGRKGKVPGSKTIKRQRLDLDERLKSMDQKLFRRKYRMGFDFFYRLLDILEPYLPGTGKKHKTPNSVPHGPITKSA